MMLLPVVLVMLACAFADQRVRPKIECRADMNDCSMVPGSACLTGSCECSGGMHYYGLEPKGCYSTEERKEAIRTFRTHILEEQLACSEEDDCDHIAESTCQHGECTCTDPKHYFRNPSAGCYTNDERKDLFKEFMEKAKAKQAKLENGDGGTIIDSEHIYISDQPPLTPCTSDEQCSHYENALCTENTCRCGNGDRFRGYGGRIGCYGNSKPASLELQRERREKRVIPVLSLSDSTCNSDSQCAAVDVNSGCHPHAGSCACFTGFYRTDDNTCGPIDVGVPCPTDGSDDHFCRRGVIRSVCSSGICQCPEGFPEKGEGLIGPACLNKQLTERVREIGERRASRTNTGGRTGGSGRSGRPSPAPGFGPRRGFGKH